ncbi:MAG: SsrA-binding protein SmpB [Bacilli bacterium]|jgi:SsrA-binding protein|nr:SsrA-binding protein SmpB [Bacilli bacterium]
MIEIQNRKAKFDYDIIETIETGIVLTGTEIKSLRIGKANLKDSYAIVRNGEVFLVNMHISEYVHGNIFNHNETRSRKLLLHKKEILKLNDKVRLEGFTLVPLKVYIKGNYAKVLLGVGKGKKLYDKREAMKERDMKRELDKAMKYK